MSNKNQDSPVVKASEIYRQRVETGDDILHSDQNGTIIWTHEGISCQVVLPSPETSDVGVLQTVRGIGLESNEIKRYFFTAVGLLDVITVRLSKQELSSITSDMFDTFMDISQLGDSEISDEDMKCFFEMFFSPFRD